MHPSQIEISNYNYNLPAQNIAEHSLPQRDTSKLLQYKNGIISHYNFSKLPELLPSNSLIIFNNSKVIPARIHFTNAANATIEIFCLEPLNTTDYALAMAQTKQCNWKCLVGNKKKWKEKNLTATINSNTNITIEIIETIDDAYNINFTWASNETFAEILLAIGKIPLPPYIKRQAVANDGITYQTIYAQHNGSVAAPTAGLHFTEAVFKNLDTKNITRNYITLHVGAGTFKPVKATHLINHTMHAEWFVINKQIIENILTHQNIFCVGTTTLRTLESTYWLGVKLLLANFNIPANTNFFNITQWQVYDAPFANSNFTLMQSMQALLQYLNQNNLEQLTCSTQIIITPSYKIKTIKALITNFHQPQSTLLLLVASIVGNNWKTIYDAALQNNYRFLSYGDSSILWL